MTNEQARIKAIQVLRRKVRFTTACFTLPDSPTMQNDTTAIIEATRLYMDSWVIPLLDCLESGNFDLVKRYYQHEPGDTMDTKQVAQNQITK